MSRSGYDAFNVHQTKKPVATTPKQRLQALGRLKAGTMNRTESAYAKLLDQRLQAGEILWFRFEAIRLILAPSTSLTVDFFLLLANGELQAVDVKGSKAIVSDDARAKTKFAASIFPWPFFFVYPKQKKDGGGWDVEEI